MSVETARFCYGSRNAAPDETDTNEHECMPIKLYQKVSKLIWPAGCRLLSPGLKNVRVRLREGQGEETEPGHQKRHDLGAWKEDRGDKKNQCAPGTVLAACTLVTGPRTPHLLPACFPSPNSQGPLPFHPHRGQGQGARSAPTSVFCCQ